VRGLSPSALRLLSEQKMSPLTLGKTMVNDTKKTKADTAPKSDTAAKAKSTAAEGALKDIPKDTPKDAPKDAAKSEGGEAAAAAPSNYSRGEGQKPVTAAYKENWNAIFAKKRTKRKKR
jgi:hypothetical protein